MWLSRNRFLWRVPVPEPSDYIGRRVRVTAENNKTRVVEIEELKNSMVYPHMFQVESKGQSYLISMLDFFAQMNGEKISPEDIKAFNETVFDVQRR